MRLHSRLVKGTFWNDPELLRWPLAKRMFYKGLWHVAEDSGCVEDSPFGFKVTLFPSPVDADITEEQLATWRDELLDEEKLVSYTVHGKPYLFVCNFHKHQTIKNPSRPDCPLPEWVEWEPYESNPRAGKYIVHDDLLFGVLQCSDGVLTDDLQSSSNGTERNGSKAKAEKLTKLDLAKSEVAATVEPAPPLPNDSDKHCECIEPLWPEIIQSLTASLGGVPIPDDQKHAIKGLLTFGNDHHEGMCQWIHEHERRCYPQEVRDLVEEALAKFDKACRGEHVAGRSIKSPYGMFWTVWRELFDKAKYDRFEKGGLSDYGSDEGRGVGRLLG